MPNLNKVFLMGNLTRDPELRYLQSGTALVTFGLAVNRKYRNRNTQELEEETTFVDVEGWGPRGEALSRYLAKGKPVFIEGRLKLDSWENREGQKRSKLVVVMEGFEFVDGGGGGGSRGASRDNPPLRAGAGQVADRRGGGGQPGPDNGSNPPEDYDFDDIPF